MWAAFVGSILIPLERGRRKQRDVLCKVGGNGGGGWWMKGERK